MKPTVTILLATYNRAHLIGETLNSIINQTYENWKCIIIDDNSKDNTKTFVEEEFIEKDTRFKFYTKDNSKYPQGLGGSRNMSLDIAEEINAEYIHFFDDDDLMHPRKLELQMDMLLSNLNYSFVTCEYEHLDTNKVLSKELKSSNLPLFSNNILEDFITRSNKVFLNSCGPIWRLKVWKNIRFNESLKIAEEFEVYSRLFIAIENIKYGAVQNILFFYRKHELSNTKNRYKDWQIKDSLYSTDLSIFDELLDKNKMSKTLLNYYIKKYVFTSFDNTFNNKIEEYIKENKLNYLKLVIKGFNIMKKIFSKIL
ncbi:glycosyltransferase involved in cell wall biosynthesis [Lacinutrix venerupis]|uniref:glycosyltransferase family 2 protein n=1 Tax=Lacinutrix venerupis TaxID=1486034 RepID=UPI000EAC298B|nr:glycosyltransferase family 2 protein [Lacinutrix venerupis]RLJ64377.1 glycosyltransferase involved in cell wall biosynthesis [Lacinutrix venerupis]